MDWTEHPKVRALRDRSRAADVAVHAAEGYRQHRTGRNAALIAHFGFLSIFPLMLVFTTVLGFVLQNNEKLRQDIIDSALSHLPFIGQQITLDPAQLTGSALVLIIGLGASLWAGMKAFIAVHEALDDIDELSLDERSNAIVSRLQALLGICYIGGAQILSAILTTLASVTAGTLIGKALLLVGTAVINSAVLALTYRWLRTRRPPWPDIIPGAIIGGVLFTVLEVLGVRIVGRAIARASPVYGTFASVIALLAWLSLHAVIALCGAELNAALVKSRSEPTRGATT